MLLYHFTAHERLPGILDGGLSKGDVPINGPTGKGLNAVWLTTDSTSEGHGLGKSGLMTDVDRHRIFQWKGEMPPEGTRWANKRAVRITVKLASQDRNLKEWLPWARRRLEPGWLAQLNESGGGSRKARTWRLYFGVIPPSAFVAVDILETEEADED
jgi:hypothetical protein